MFGFIKEIILLPVNLVMGVVMATTMYAAAPKSKDKDKNNKKK